MIAILPPNTQNDTDTDADKNLDRLLQEMQARRYEFEIETQEDVNALQEDFISERHYLHVTDEAISEELARGLRSVNDAADSIDLSEDDEDTD